MGLPTSTYDLTTIADVQRYLNSSVTANNDPIQFLITAISVWVGKYCGRDFRQATYTETRNGRGQDQMFTRQAPINSVTSITIDGVLLPLASGSPPQSGYLNDADSVYVFNPYQFTRNKQNCVLVYNAGWVTPGMGGTVTLPQDLQQAVVESVSERFKRRDSIGVLAKALAGETITYSQADLPKSAAPVIDSYRMVNYYV